MVKPAVARQDENASVDGNQQSRVGETVSTADSVSSPVPSRLSSLENHSQFLHLDLPLKSRLRPSTRNLFATKVAWLQTHQVPVPDDLTHNPVPATLVFAHEDAGSAVCISPNGLILTCAHCVTESPSQHLDVSQVRWLIFANGEAVGAGVIACDIERDLALLLVSERSGSETTFPFIPIASIAPKLNAPLVCVSHPDSTKLKNRFPDVLVLSTGAFRGLTSGQDPHLNMNVGALTHDCWAYRGHGGAPLVDRESGGLVGLGGLESLPDRKKGVRRGVPWEAIDAFFDELDRQREKVSEGWKWCERTDA